MFENFYFDARMFNRNKKLAEYLDVNYTPAIHKAYKQNLNAMKKPVRSLPQVIFEDVYNEGLAGTNYGYANIRGQDKEESDREYASYIRKIAAPLILAGKDTKNFARLKTKVGCCTEAFRMATDAKIETHVELWGFAEKILLENSENMSDVCIVRPYFDLKHGKKCLNPCWHQPKGHGFSNLDIGIYL